MSYNPVLKQKFMDLASVSYYIWKKFVVPYEFVQKVEKYYYYFADNELDLKTFGDIIFSFCLSMFDKAITKHNIKTYLDLLKLMKQIKDSIETFYDVSNECDYLFTFRQVKKVIKELDSRNFSMEEKINFVDFYYENSKLIFGNKILLENQDMETLFKVYDELKKKGE